MLHTWKQDLGRHVHVHALMAGGALSADGRVGGGQARLSVSGQGAVQGVSRQVRRRPEAGSDKREAAPGAGSPMHAWRDLLARLYAHDWVVYAKQPLGGPAQVLDYLGRYTHRVAISNERILGMDEDTVSLRVRDWTHGNRRRTLRLPAQTFIERFLLHVLPKGFKRIRHYGLLGPAGKALKLGAGARRAVGSATRSRRGRVGGRVHAPHRPTRVGALSALRAGMLRAHGTIPASKGHLLHPRGPP